MDSDLKICTRKPGKIYIIINMNYYHENCMSVLTSVARPTVHVHIFKKLIHVNATTPEIIKYEINYGLL